MADEALSGAGRVRQARDVMAFGQELGRVLSDGRIVALFLPVIVPFGEVRRERQPGSCWMRSRESHLQQEVESEQPQTGHVGRVEGGELSDQPFKVRKASSVASAGDPRMVGRTIEEPERAGQRKDCASRRRG